MNLLHIYAQNHWHDQVIIVGDREALESLIRTLRYTIDHDQSSSEPVFVNDGEGYNVLVYQASQEEMDRLPVPYTDEIAGTKDWGELIKLMKDRRME